MPKLVDKPAVQTALVQKLRSGAPSASSPWQPTDSTAAAPPINGSVRITVGAGRSGAPRAGHARKNAPPAPAKRPTYIATRLAHSRLSTHGSPASAAGWLADA